MKAPAKKIAAASKATGAKTKAPKKATHGDDDDDASDNDDMDMDEPTSRASSSRAANGTTNGTLKKKTASETYQKVRGP
jgi:hypothetical protein